MSRELIYQHRVTVYLCLCMFAEEIMRMCVERGLET